MMFFPDSFSQNFRRRNLSETYQKIYRDRVAGVSFKLSAFAALLFGLTACTASNTLENTVAADPQTHEAQTYDNKTKGTKSEGNPVSGPVMTLRTVMTAEGVECPAVRGDDGTLYTIPSMPHKFEEGDVLNITVSNPIVPVASFCQQGETIDWIRIEKLSVSGEILKHWEK